MQEYEPKSFNSLSDSHGLLNPFFTVADLIAFNSLSDSHCLVGIREDTVLPRDLSIPYRILTSESERISGVIRGKTLSIPYRILT